MDEVKKYLKHFSKKVSKDLCDYATNEVFLSSRYMFIHREGKQQLGYCTHCRKEFETEGLKHNQRTVCPGCKSECIIKASGRGRKQLVDCAYFVYYEKSVINPKTIVARGLYAERSYKGDYKNVETRFTTEALYVFDMEKGAVMLEPYSYWSGKKGLHVRNTMTSQYYKNNQSWMDFVGYSRESIKKAVEGTPFSWSGWESYDYQDMVKFFDLYIKYPAIEYLTKLGFTEPVRNKLEGQLTHGAINWRGKTLFKVLRLSKQEFGEIKSQGVYVTCWFLNLLKLNKVQEWGFSIGETAELARDFDSHYDLDRLLKMLQYGSIRKILNYLSKQYNKRSYYSKTSFLGTWIDYLKDCKELEMDLTKENVIFPRNLYTAHQNTIKQIKYKKNEQLNGKIKERVKDLKKYCFSYAGLMIRPAESAKELIDEGSALNHCVGGYAKNYADGLTGIFFIRKISEPERPYFTMELHENRIRQTRGLRNCDPDKKVQAFIKAFTEAKLQKKKNKTKIAIPA